MAEQNAPDFLVFAQNVASLFPSIYTVLAAFFVLVGFGMAFDAILDFAQAGEKSKKFMGRHQATAMSGVIKLLIAGALLNFASTGQIAAVVSSAFFDNNEFTLISIDSYVGNADENPMQKYTKLLIIGFTQTVGLIGIFKGLRMWGRISDRSSNDSAWHGLSYIILGTLCLQVTQVLEIITNTVGFDFFKMVGLT